MRRVNTIKTQILHRIRLKKVVRRTPVNDNYSSEKLQADDEIVKPQDDLYTISWKVDFDYALFETRKDIWPDTATRLPNDDASGEVDCYVTVKEGSNVNEDERSSERSNENEVSENEIRPKPAINRDVASSLNGSPGGTENENGVTDELNSDENVSKSGADITVPGISENEYSEETSSHRGGLYNLRPKSTPIYTDEYR